MTRPPLATSQSPRIVVTPRGGPGCFDLIVSEIATHSVNGPLNINFDFTEIAGVRMAWDGENDPGIVFSVKALRRFMINWISAN